MKLTNCYKETATTLLSTCVEDYLGDCYGLAESTKQLYRWHMERFLAVVGDAEMEDWDAVRAVRSFMAGLRKNDGELYSPDFLDQVYRTLNTFFSWGVREECLPQNPMARVRRPRVPKRKSPRLTLDEIERLLAAVQRTQLSERNLAIVCLMVDSGLRRGEVLNLTVRDVDLNTGVVRAFGKDKEDRDIPAGPVTCQTVAAYLTVRPVSSSDVLFLTCKGTPLTKNGLGIMMHRLKKRADLPQLRCHLLRHTFANHYLANGGSLRRLQKILGHASVETTAAIYLDPELVELQREHTKVSPLANGVKFSFPS